MTYPIKESFTWMEPNFRVNKGTGKNKVIIKGRALFAGVTSKNLRKYVKEELVRAARTLVGKPITINHDPKRIVGHVIDAEEEENAIEYVGEINKKDYAQKLLDRNIMDAKSYYNKWFVEPINGVSVEADYQHTRCTQCGKNFYDIETLTDHMHEEHKLFNFKLEPHRIFMKALSLVEPPEVPGVSGTTIELMEKAEGKSRLMETLTKDLTEIEKMKTKKEDKTKKVKPATPTYLTGTGTQTSDELRLFETDVTVTPEVGGDKGTPPPLETPEEPKPTGEPHSCPEGFHWDEKIENCVPDAVTEPKTKPEEPELGPPSSPPPLETLEQDTSAPTTPEAPTKVEKPTCPEGSHYDEESGSCQPDGADLGTEPKNADMPVTEFKLPAKLRLGEPFASYTSFDDCVSKNQDKGDPAAYCATIKRKTEGETAPDIKETLNVYDTFNSIKENLRRLDTISIQRDIKNAEAINQLNEATASQHINTQKSLKNLKKQMIMEGQLRGRCDNSQQKKIKEVMDQAKTITTHINKMATDANKSIEQLVGSETKLVETVNQKLTELGTADTKVKEYTDKKLTELATAYSKMKGNLDTFNKEIHGLTEKLSKLEEYGKALDALEKQYQDFVKAKEQEEEIPTCPDGEHYDKQQKKCVPNESTAAEIKKLTEMVTTRLDNIEDKVKAQFKGVSKTATPEGPELDAKDPYK